MKIIFPKFCGQRYWNAHFRHCLSLFSELQWDVEYFTDTTGERGCFKMYLDGVEVMVDFSDYGSEYSGPLPTLRFHHKRDNAVMQPCVYPFTQCSFWDWHEYREFEAKTEYKAQGLVMHNQRSSNTNVARRDKVRKIVEQWTLGLSDHSHVGRASDGRYLSGADTQWHDNARKYWGTLNNCLVSIHVPGQNNNMLDTAQVQLMGFGVCTISPYLPELLAFGKRLEDGIHYVKCANDYGDLVNQIEWCRAHREECVKIGRQAKQLFQETMTPQAAGAWLTHVVEVLKK